MKINKVEIKNFRLLKDFEISLEDNLSLIVGKNNTGKTSFLTILNNFLNKNRFCYDDLNIDLQADIKKLIENEEKNTFNEFVKNNSLSVSSSEIGISMKLHITYDESDNISNISNLMLDLEPENREIIIEFLYYIDKDIIDRIRSDFMSVKNTSSISFEKFIQKTYKNYFVLKQRVLDGKDEKNSKDIDDIKILSNIINLKYISAKREISNNENNKDAETLSKKAEKYYNLISNNSGDEILDLQRSILETDEKLTENYKKLFSGIIDEIAELGGINSNDAKLKIKSNLQDKNLLSSNTLVKYNCDDNGELPENYNGLGYLNFISMIFDIYLTLEDFKRKNKKENPADINILFIEEPEAHTHPQMQYIFIRKIKEFLLKHKQELNLQTIITTHSSHIIAEDDFSDIKYFLIKEKNEVVSKNLKDYFTIMTSNKNKDKEFLKKYLTVDKTELFFADKAILIEGDTERLLMPIFMKMIDKEEDDHLLPLLSQNISIISVGGSHAHIFIDFLNFLEIKTLIITDLDPGKKNKDGTGHAKKYKTSLAEISMNSTIKKILGCEDIKEIGKNKEKIFDYDSKEEKYRLNENGKIYLSYQTEENGYIAASFEDAFISINLNWIRSNEDNFKTLSSKNLKSNNYYEIAESLSKCKTDFALDIIYNIDENFTSIRIPQYIKEGLEWLKE